MKITITKKQLRDLYNEKPVAVEKANSGSCENVDKALLDSVMISIIQKIIHAK